MHPHRATSYSVVFKFANGASVTLRTSGTEPKIKYYSEVRADSRDTAEALLAAMIPLVLSEWYLPDVHGFEPAAG